MSRRESESSGRIRGEVAVPPMNERPYYMKRVESLLDSKRVYDYKRKLEGFHLSTLKLIDSHENTSDFTSNLFRNVDEDELRSGLLLATLPEHKERGLTALIEAGNVLRLHHKLEDSDFTKLHREQVAMLSAAAAVLIATGYGDAAPPKLTYFVMERPDEAEHIIGFLKEFYSSKSQVHKIDLEHLEDYLNDEVTALRVGTL